MRDMETCVQYSGKVICSLASLSPPSLVHIHLLLFLLVQQPRVPGKGPRKRDVETRREKPQSSREKETLTRHYASTEEEAG